MTLIYIRSVKKEPVQWWPAEAAQVSEGTYRITSVPQEEPLEFAVGDLVRVQPGTFPDGSEALLAVAKA